MTDVFQKASISTDLAHRLITAIGVSGGHYTQDMEVAQAGLDVLG